MSYRTVLIITRQTRLILLKTIFEQNNIKFRFLDETTGANYSMGVKVQVGEKDVKRAEVLLRENGFIKHPELEKNDVSWTRFWIFLVLALLVIIIVSIIINSRIR